MRRSIASVSAVVAASAALSALGIFGISEAGAATQAARRLAAQSAPVRALAAPGARLWVARYNGPGNSSDIPHQVAVSPDGTRVYVTGESFSTSSSFDYATVAYNAATGAQLWAARYNGPANGFDVAHALAVSPDGSRVYVTGSSEATGSQGDYATIAYNAATGSRLWLRRYNSRGGDDEAYALAVSPDGTVYVTGQSLSDYATIAYSTAGTRLWVARYSNAIDRGRAVAVSKDGSRVYVTGVSSRTGGWDYATLGYNAATGAQLWVRRYNSPLAADADYPPSLAVSAAGTVIVAGIRGPISSAGYATIAYSATGTQLWAAPLTVGGAAASVAAPGTGKVYVTGTGGTVARSVFTGRKLWIQTHKGALSSVTVANGKVYVTGSTLLDSATIAYDAATGARLWAQHYNGPGNGSDQARSLAARAGRVFVTGYSQGITSDYDYATIAYNG